jgi:hypothetical protein
VPFAACDLVKYNPDFHRRRPLRRYLRRHGGCPYQRLSAYFGCCPFPQTRRSVVFKGANSLGHIGPAGSGKWTLPKIIGGLIPAFGGELG